MNNAVRLDIFGNFFGRATPIILSFVLIPLLLKRFGVEILGMIGLQVSLGAIFSSLDFGLQMTVNREASRSLETPEEFFDFFQAVEVIVWFLAIIIGLLFFIFANGIAHSWIQLSTESLEGGKWAIRAIGLVVALQIPLLVYSNGLQGFHRQIKNNQISIFFEVVRLFFTFVLVGVGSAGMEHYFLLNAALSFVQCLTLRFSLFRVLSSRVRNPLKGSFFNLARHWKFSIGTNLTNICVLITSQFDKIVLSRFISLADFGLYSLAWSLVTNFGTLVNPVFVALLPRLSDAWSKDNVIEVKKLYHFGNRLLAAFVMPALVSLFFYASSFLLLWTRDPWVASQSAPFVQILLVGTLLNVIATMPYSLQLASGETRVALSSNLFAACCVGPFLIPLARTYGAAGLVLIWPAVNFVNAILGLPWTHRFLLKENIFSSLRADFLEGIFAILSAGTALWWFGQLLGVGDWRGLTLSLAGLYIFAFILFRKDVGSSFLSGGRWQ
jgi:O-antigen/teichoic acid export membrane protein